MVGTRVITLAFLSLFTWRTSVLGAHLQDDVEEKPSIEADMTSGQPSSSSSSSSPSSGEVVDKPSLESQGTPLLDAECAQSLQDTFEKKNCDVPIGEVVEIGQAAAKAEGVLDPKDLGQAAGAVVVSVEVPLKVPGMPENDERKAEEQAQTNVKRLEQVLVAETSGAGSASLGENQTALQGKKKVAAIRQVKENVQAKLDQSAREEVAVVERANEDAHQASLAAHTAANAAVQMVVESAAAKKNIVVSAAKDRQRLIVSSCKLSAASIKDNIEHDRKPGSDSPALDTSDVPNTQAAGRVGIPDGQPRAAIDCGSSSDLLAGLPQPSDCDRKAVATAGNSTDSQHFETSAGDPL